MHGAIRVRTSQEEAEDFRGEVIVDEDRFTLVTRGNPNEQRSQKKGIV